VAGEVILIVEDTEVNLDLARVVLQPHGYETLEARTAAEAIALATENLPDLVLMDIQLPDSDGIRALERLRGNAEPTRSPSSR
jgi:two-component system, cell cycle response regulator DivK